MLFLMIALMVVGVLVAVAPLLVTIAKTSDTAGGSAIPAVAADDFVAEVESERAA